MAISDKWRVEVHANGEMILAIEDDALCGVDNITDHRDTIVNCANNLLDFIGPEKKEECSFDCEDRGILIRDCENCKFIPPF